MTLIIGKVSCNVARWRMELAILGLLFSRFQQTPSGSNDEHMLEEHVDL